VAATKGAGSRTQAGKVTNSLVFEGMSNDSATGFDRLMDDLIVALEAPGPLLKQPAVQLLLAMRGRLDAGLRRGQFRVLRGGQEQSGAPAPSLSLLRTPPA
jgi:hypothetical protein